MITPTPTHTAMPNVQATAPERIYLVIGEDVEPDTDFDDLGRGMESDGVTWCADKIDDNSIPYVRADLASLPAPQGEQRSDIELCATLCDDLRAKAMSNGQDAAAGWLHQAASHMRGLDSRPSSVAPGGLPLPQADSKDDVRWTLVHSLVASKGWMKGYAEAYVDAALSGDSVSAPVEPPGATLSPCAASQWISVDTRLPPLNTEVLIAFDTSTLPATGQLTMYRGIRQWCWPAENDPAGDESLRAVTHWAFMRHPSEIGEWAQVGESSIERGAA